MDKNKPSIIILGGSSFMGLTLLKLLSLNISKFSYVFILNRGK